MPCAIPLLYFYDFSMQSVSMVSFSRPSGEQVVQEGYQAWVGVQYVKRSTGGDKRSASAVLAQSQRRADEATRGKAET